MTELEKVANRRYVLLSLRERYFEAIKSGRKLFEYRTRYPDAATVAFIYVSQSRKEIVGFIEFGKPIKGRSIEIAEFAAKNDGADYDEMVDWLAGRDGCAIPVEKIVLFESLPVSHLKEVFPEFSVPQSYYYLDNKPELLQYLLDYGDKNRISSSEYEQELKFLCSEAVFFKLYDEYIVDKNPVRQVNYYFDKDNELHERGIVLRIRERLGKYTLTIKEKKDRTRGIALETTETISLETFLQIMHEGKIVVQNHIKGSLTGEYDYLGQLETVRDEVKTGGILLVFDHSRYFGIEDYEIEIEGRHDLTMSFLDNLKLDVKKITMSHSKFARFRRKRETGETEKATIR